MDASQIKEQMEVVGSDGMHVGTIDHVEGEQIKLTRRDSDDNMHHYIPTDWVESVSGNEARLNKLAEEAKAEWTESGDDEISGGRADSGEMDGGGGT